MAARRAASLTGRVLLSRSSPCYLHGGRVGWVPPAGRGGWRCGRHRRREGNRGTAHRTADVPSRPAAARCAPPVAASPLLQASLFRVAVAQVHLCQVRHGENNDARRGQANNRHPSHAAHADSQETIEQQGAYQPSFVGEAHAVRAIDQNGPDSDQTAVHGRVVHGYGFTCGSRMQCVPHRVKEHVHHHHGCPGPRAHSLCTHRVLHSLDQHAADQAECRCHAECAHAHESLNTWWRRKREPDEGGDTESHQEDVASKGQAEEMRCKSQLVGGVCEGARDRVHCDGGGRRRRRLEVRVVLAARGVAGQQRRHRASRHVLGTLVVT